MRPFFYGQNRKEKAFLKKKENNKQVDQYKKILCRNGDITIGEICIYRQEYIPELFGCESCEKNMGKKSHTQFTKNSQVSKISLEIKK